MTILSVTDLKSIRHSCCCEYFKYITKTHHQNISQKHIAKTYHNNTSPKHITKTHHQNVSQKHITKTDHQNTVYTSLGENKPKRTRCRKRTPKSASPSNIICRS